MTTSKSILRRLHHQKPRNPQEFKDRIGVQLHEYGDGCFREVYRIGNTQMIIKFPMNRDGIWHGRREIRRIREIKRRRNLSHLARYIPRMLYADVKGGILVMQLVHRLGEVSLEESVIVGRLFADTFGRTAYQSDIMGDNIGSTNSGQIKLVDLGCV